MPTFLKMHRGKRQAWRFRTPLETSSTLTTSGCKRASPEREENLARKGLVRSVQRESALKNRASARASIHLQALTPTSPLLAPLNLPTPTCSLAGRPTHRASPASSRITKRAAAGGHSAPDCTPYSPWTCWPRSLASFSQPFSNLAPAPGWGKKLDAPQPLFFSSKDATSPKRRLESSHARWAALPSGYKPPTRGQRKRGRKKARSTALLIGSRERAEPRVQPLPLGPCGKSICCLLVRRVAGRSPFASGRRAGDVIKHLAVRGGGGETRLFRKKKNTIVAEESWSNLRLLIISSISKAGVPGFSLDPYSQWRILRLFLDPLSPRLNHSARDITVHYCYRTYMQHRSVYDHSYKLHPFPLLIFLFSKISK